MCELLAMSTEYPTNLTLSLRTLAEHSSSGGHVDGWGIAYYEGKDIRRIRDTAPAHESPWISHVADHGLTSDLVIAHIRKATVGTVALENTQPFQRELGGHIHAFAHNGDLHGALESDRYRSRYFRSVGTTDSEVVFCYLLEKLRDAWLGNAPPGFETRWQIFQETCAEFRAMGPANFFYSDGEYLYVHGNRRTQEDGVLRPPGLHWLCRKCTLARDAELSGEALCVTTTRLEVEIQRVVLVASVPLTDEPWEAMAEGEMLALRAGEIVARA
ncbi:MAG: class II glutamine amidotransferase [Gammaproteobacteria bacterium]|nr:class II glutamine amidotransferase [Gammaproteobacteria bacterium]NNF50275.1 class II glutamine amidotransferase [Woeseiaceae bacterium]MBT8095237.1 class II glutamine amidotransferase [Gammaproteobacteria bacterium]MBT8105646.1 class II glutamine amidotransferase [Gammaproteobacteria bacterium]NNK25660.1 class II glutamine amidotransferase [Woeseiaceae bacterium]